MSKKIRVAICDDMPQLCRYFKNFLSIEEDMEVCAMAHSARACVEMVREQTPDVLLLDIQMEVYDSGVKAIPKILEASPHTKIIMLTVHDESEQVFKAFTFGVSDYRIKSAPNEEIISAIRNVYNNKTSLRPDIAKKIVDESNKIRSQSASLLNSLNIILKLTTAEYEILKDLCDNLSYKEIAKKRFVEEITIRSQISRILKKFEISQIGDLVHTLNSLGVFRLLERHNIR
ncbi:MAG: response regulator transcription factor [Clostridia bacterium]|nr:response regulator transcription factor [Clostridia bacterium]